LICQKQRKA